MKNIIDQMMHDICGKATILNIMNELYSNTMIQNSIEDLINFILKFRKEIGENNIFNTLNEKSSFLIVSFLNSVISKSDTIINFTDDLDICAAVDSLKNNSLGFKCFFSNTFDKDIILQIAKEKLINISNIYHLDILTGLVLILKENCSIIDENHSITINNINFNIFKSNNGILNFLCDKYKINHEFKITSSSILINFEKFI